MATRTGWAFVINISGLSQDTRRKAVQDIERLGTLSKVDHLKRLL